MTRAKRIYRQTKLANAWSRYCLQCDRPLTADDHRDEHLACIGCRMDRRAA